MAKTDGHDERVALEGIAAAIVPAPLDAARRESMRTRVHARIQAMTLEGTHTVRASEGGWRAFLPLIEVKVLHRDDERRRQTVLYRLQPGAEFPSHPHHGDEECLVLEGEVSVGDLCLRSGDYHFARSGSLHPPMQSRPGALLLIQQAFHA